ncbi:MAG: synthase subunit [Thermoleophilia bacterium]|nr:synthase subunit [Thermoleophilia bacterium]
MTTANATATPDLEPSNVPVPNVPSPNELDGDPKPRLGWFGKLFFPVAFALMAVWFVVILGQDKLPKEEFDPTEEFKLTPLFNTDSWGALAINKGVVYLFIALLGCVLFAWYVNRAIVSRHKQETKTQSAIEGVYEFAHDQIAGSLPEGKLFNRYMPYTASIFVFVWLLNMTSFVPLPLGHENIGDISFLKAFGVYAVTSNIFCTITLALLTFAIYHYEGIKAHGFVGYLKTWSAGQKGPVLLLVYPVEILTNLVLKPVSLAVRLFANMLSGHVLILLMMALAGVIGGAVITSVFAQAAGTVVALAFYLFEMGLVASLQAFIFAVLSAIYIASAAEEHH